MSDGKKSPKANISNQNGAIKWMLVGQHGEPTGPYLTVEVVKLIREGRIVGSERIRKLPDGKWIEISREPEFYDRLLEALEESIHSKGYPKSVFKEENSPKKLVEPPPTTDKTPTEDQGQESEQIDSPIDMEKLRLRKDDGRHDVSHETKLVARATVRPPLELLPKPEESRKRKLSILIPVSLIMAAGALITVGSIFFETGTKKDSKPHLLAPKISSNTNLSNEKIKEGINKAVVSFLEDSYQANLNAQNSLVSVIEGAPMNIEARGLLCLVYRQLWPFVQQDSQDLETINVVTKSTRQLDPIGINGIYCEISKMLISGKNQEAKGVLDQALNQTGLSAAPVLYALKAELLSWSRDFQTAALYSDKARKLWPEWVRPSFDYADFLIRAGNAQQGIAVLDEILKSKTKYKKGMIEKGVTLYRSYRQSEPAFTLLSAAVSLKDKVENNALFRAYSVLALIFMEKKENKKALQYAELAYVLNPSDATVKDLVVRLGGSGRIEKRSAQTAELIYLGDQYQRSGDCLAAQAEYKAAFEIEPSNGNAALKAAKCLWQLNQAGEAINYLSKAIVADRNLATAYVLQADYYSQKYNYSAASQVLTRASQVLTNNYEILRGYGLVEYRRNNLKEALAYLQRAQKIFENDLETLVLLANVYGGLRQYKEASIYASRAIELDSTNVEAQTVFAKIIAQLYGVDQGVSRFKELILKFSYTIDFRIGLADLYREAERFKPAQDILQQIVEVDPRNKKAWLGLGESYQAQGLSDKAIKAYLNAAIIDPTDAEALFRTGKVYLEREKYKEAIAQFQRALKSNYLFPRLNYYIGKAYFLNGDYTFALSSAQEERKINPNLADSYLLAAEVYAETKQFQKCAEEYQFAIKLRPQGSELYVKLARCYRQAGSPDIAESMLNIAANQESGNPDIYREQGAIYETKGDIRSAIAAYNKYLALSPNASDRREIEARIIRLSGN